jgi:hypothetical protein
MTEAPKCKLCGERHWGMCPDTDETRVAALWHQAGFRALYERHNGEIEKLDTNGGYRFVCRDCDIEVYSYGVKPETPVCATCLWIAEFGAELPDDEKRRLRDR